MRQAIIETFKHRGTEFHDIVAFESEFVNDIVRQTRWNAFVSKKRAMIDVGFKDALALMKVFLLPIVESITNDLDFQMKWNPETGRWGKEEYDRREGRNMKKLLIVVDMQKDFVDGSLGTKEAQQIVCAVEDKIKAYVDAKDEVVFTRDTHLSDYLNTREGRKLPVEHCIQGTPGWEIIKELQPYAKKIFDKPTFGSLSLVDYVVKEGFDDIELVGLCTDICVVSNALLLKANLKEAEISVDASCCAGVTPETHEAALTTMKMCQINVI